MRRKKGFAFTMAALTLSLIVISYCFVMIYFLAPIYVETLSEGSLSDGVYRSIIIGAGVAASRSQDPDGAAEGYINSALRGLTQLSYPGLDILQFNGTGSGKRWPSSGNSQIYNIIYKHSPGNGDGFIKVLNLPPGGEVLLVDKDLNLIYRTNSSVLEFTGRSREYYLIVYTKDAQRWRYSGTISINYKYIIEGSSIVSSAWSPPMGFPYIAIFGVPHLGLIEVYDESNAFIAESLKDFWSNVTFAMVPPTPFRGWISVTSPNTWYFGELEGGEVFVYG
ncbi:MAG: hypothetical protein ACUVQ5_00100 [Candidatus Methanomethylicaceae archaeon]